MLDGHIWFCPRSEELKKEFPEFVREAIAVDIKRSLLISNRVKKLIEESTIPDIDVEQQMQEIEELVHDRRILASCKKVELMPSFM